MNTVSFHSAVLSSNHFSSQRVENTLAQHLLKEPQQASKSLASYKAERVNALLHIDQSRELELDQQAHECGNVLVSHGVSEFVAVSRLHNHYQLKENEKIVVSVEDSSKSRLSNSLEPNTAVIVKKPQLSKEGDVPYIFKFNSDGQVVPLEYISGELKDKELLKRLSNQAELVVNNKKFQSDLLAVLIKQNNVEHLGFQLIFEDDIIARSNEEEVLHEDNWYRYQEVAYRPFEPTQKATVTSWRFAPGDKEARCYCRGRCYCRWTGQSHMHLSDGHNQYD